MKTIQNIQREFRQQRYHYKIINKKNQKAPMALVR